MKKTFFLIICMLMGLLGDTVMDNDDLNELKSIIQTLPIEIQGWKKLDKGALFSPLRSSAKSAKDGAPLSASGFHQRPCQHVRESKGFFDEKLGQGYPGPGREKKRSISCYRPKKCSRRVCRLCKLLLQVQQRFRKKGREQKDCFFCSE